MSTFRYISRFGCSKSRLFAFHESPQGFDALVGAMPGIEVLEKPKGLEKGNRAVLKVPLLPFFKVRWEALHVDYQEGKFFVDRQVSGPFAEFEHRHEFSDDGDGSLLKDEIRFRFFMDPISKYFVFLLLRMQFSLRHKTTASELQTSRHFVDCTLE